MKYVFVGDIHGKCNLVEEALSKEGMKIFVGDFQDSFDRSTADHAKCNELVLAAIDKGEARAIFGNHELSYMMNHHRCSGYDYKRQQMFQTYEKEIRQKFEPYIMLDENFLVSHAGLTKQIFDDEKLTIELLPDVLHDWWENKESPMHYIGRARGGFAKVGGMFWCDYRYEFEPIPDLIQVFGHTRGTCIRQHGTNYCIDCLDYEVSFLEMDI